MSETDTLADVIVGELRQAPQPGSPELMHATEMADRIAGAIHDRYHIIPVAETDEMRIEYQVPDPIALDAAAAPQVHRGQFIQLAASAAGAGWLVISGTFTVAQLPILPDTPPGVTRFRLTALGWRLEQPTPTQETPTS